MFKKRKLNLREIHELYLLLKPYLPEKEEQYLVYEIIKIMEKITPQEFQRSLLIMYGNKFNFKQNPGKLAIKFVDGIKENDFFAYTHFIESIK